MNYSAGVDMWKNCGATKDYIQFALLPWMWITGGYFSMILAGVLILATWLKFHKAIYPILVGIAFLPIAYTLFPTQFLNFALILAALEIGLLIIHTFISRTVEE